MNKNQPQDYYSENEIQFSYSDMQRAEKRSRRIIISVVSMLAFGLLFFGVHLAGKV